MTTTIPCRAKDPHTCPYHGAEIRMKEALEAGDGDAYLKAQDDMAKAAHTTPEVKEFFQQAAIATAPINTTTTRHYAPTAATFEDRFDTALKDYDYTLESISDENPNYNVGGYAEKLTYEPSTGERRAYQTAAEIIIKNSLHPDGRYYTPGMRVISDATAVRQALQKKANIAANEGTRNLAETYGKIIRDNINKTGIPGSNGNFIDTREALQNLDDAYWQQPTGSGEEARVKVEDANLSRFARIDGHFESGRPYLVGGTADDIADTQFTASRLVYQRAANTLLANARKRTRLGVTGYVVDYQGFHRDWRTMKAATLDNAILDEIQPAGDLDETRRTLDQVELVLESRFAREEFGGTTAPLQRALASLDNAYWNAPNGPVNRPTHL